MAENAGKHIENIVAVTECKRHQALVGMACWYVSAPSGVKSAVCGKRVRAVWSDQPADPKHKTNHGYRGQKKKDTRK